jgi:hypothetical protein
MVARERFELSSMAPKATMLDHYTNGLHTCAYSAEVLTTHFYLISILANNNKTQTEKLRLHK